MLLLDVYYQALFLPVCWNNWLLYWSFKLGGCWRRRWSHVRQPEQNIYICRFPAIFRQANHVGEAGLRNSNLIWNVQFHIYTKRLLANSSIPGRISATANDDNSSSQNLNQMSSLRSCLIWSEDVLIELKIISAKCFWYLDRFYFTNASAWRLRRLMEHSFSIVELQTFC